MISFRFRIPLSFIGFGQAVLEMFVRPLMTECGHPQGYIKGETASKCVTFVPKRPSPATPRACSSSP